MNVAVSRCGISAHPGGKDNKCLLQGLEVIPLRPNHPEWANDFLIYVAVCAQVSSRIMYGTRRKRHTYRPLRFCSGMRLKSMTYVTSCRASISISASTDPAADVGWCEGTTGLIFA